MAIKDSNIAISSLEFITIANQIQNATSLDVLFKETITILGAKRVSYHHLLDFGERKHGDRKRYFSYNIPPAIIDYFENEHDVNSDPGITKVFSTGHFISLSEMAMDEQVIQQGNDVKIKSLLTAIGDGLLIPLYGPNNRRGYLFAGFGKEKTTFTSDFSWKVQCLAQIAHVKYCLMLLSIKEKIKLTDREIEVLELITFGKTNPEIGLILNISTNTVSGYVKQIFLKLGTSDRVTTALRARSLNLLF